jgi:hypothetical protein
MTVPDTVTATRPSSVDIAVGLALLAEAGVTTESLTAAHVDITDRYALRTEIEHLLVASVTNAAIASDAQVDRLVVAYKALYTPDEREELAAVFEALARSVIVSVATDRGPDTYPPCVEAD